ncbi:MAG: phosphoglucosamine mutase [Gemmatimonadota bacterium]|nr:MAG: phosphoglucosamine mutase [Gemmatimonadota bacterium]
MNDFMISVSGVRGIVGRSISPDIVARFAAAFGTFMERGHVVIGRDSRESGEWMKHAVVSGLLSTGCGVVDLGICPTPTVQLMAEEYDGGVVITASHNPAEWNGLKFIRGNGLFLDTDQGAELLHVYKHNTIHYANWDASGDIVHRRDALKGHIDRILRLELLNVEAVRRRKFSVVIDCCNGAASTVGPQLLSALGCEVIALHCQPTGVFPHNPEPVPAHLDDLCSAVKNKNADVGFALDPDGDRLSIVSNQGEALGEEYTLAIAAKYMVSKRKGPVVVNLSTSKMIDDIAAEADVPVIRTAVGEIHVALRMREVDSIFGGEGNGGVILPEAHYGRDALVGIALILQALGEWRAALSEVVETMPRYHIVKRKYELRGEEPAAVMEMLADVYAKQSPDVSDGVKVNWSDRWVHVRSSNTEPVLRVIAEAPTHKEAEELCDGTIRTIESLKESQTLRTTM